MTIPFRVDCRPLPASFWTQIFHDPHPVAIEIGPGLGEFLEVIARRQPDWNFYAIERAPSRARAVQMRIDSAGLGNARVVCAAAEFALALMPSACVGRVYVQFPDPWWKRRHHRRRLVTPAFVGSVHRVLRTGASVEFVTDVAEYFARTREILDAHPGLERIETEHELLTATSFSHKADLRGWKIHAASYRKLPPRH
jgi:tRNA (guanine-N7-)-methyltransferase